MRDILFYLEYAELPYKSYRVKISTEGSVVAVLEEDGKLIRDYVNGVIDSCTQLQSLAAISKDNDVVEGIILNLNE